VRKHKVTVKPYTFGDAMVHITIEESQKFLEDIYPPEKFLSVLRSILMHIDKVFKGLPIEYKKMAFELSAPHLIYHIREQVKAVKLLKKPARIPKPADLNEYLEYLKSLCLLVSEYEFIDTWMTVMTVKKIASPFHYWWLHKIDPELLDGWERRDELRTFGVYEVGIPPEVEIATLRKLREAMRKYEEMYGMPVLKSKSKGGMLKKIAEEEEGGESVIEYEERITEAQKPVTPDWEKRLREYRV